MLQPNRSCLIVDDLRSIRQQVATWLTGKGFACLEAKDGSRGWELIESSKIDLLITDIDLPGMSGFDLIRKLRHSDIDQVRRLPTLVMSSLQDREIERIVKENQGDGFVMKPLEKTSFLDAVFCTLRGDPSCGVFPAFEQSAQQVSPQLRRLSCNASRIPINAPHRKL